MEIKREEARLEIDVFQYGFTSKEAVPLETVVSQTISSNGENDQINMLSPAVVLFWCR